MKSTHLIVLSALCFTQVHAFTLPRQPTKSYECDDCSKLSHENLHAKWEISNEPLNHELRNTQKSFGYRENVALEDLQKGYGITTLAPGAVIRITPLQDKPIPQLQIITPSNQLMTLKEASTLYSEDESFGEARMSAKHQTIFQIKSELGAGKFLLKNSAQNTKNGDRFLISVYDKYSESYLQVETDSVHYQYGDKLTAIISLNGEDTDKYTIDNVEASAISPKGQVIPLKLSEIKPNQYEGNATLLSELNDRGENWYVEAKIQTEFRHKLIKRSGHAAFSYSVPSASLINLKKLSSRPLTFVATVDVATASRYALQSVLFRKNGKGETKPVETSQRAQWLEPGKQLIQFTFDNSNQFTDDTLYLGYLRLIDYGQLKTVYQFNQPIKLSQLLD